MRANSTLVFCHMAALLNFTWITGNIEIILAPSCGHITVNIATPEGEIVVVSRLAVEQSRIGPKCRTQKLEAQTKKWLY